MFTVEDTMELLIFALTLSACFVIGENAPANEIKLEPDINDDIMSNKNITDQNKDMYVIHAMVYQVGIITNKTEDELNNTGLVGNQEAVTFYHTNGSGIDLNNIPEPLVTNVTAQRLVGVAPITGHSRLPGNALPWAQLDKLATSSQHPTETLGNPRQSRDSTSEAHYEYPKTEGGSENFDENPPYLKKLFKRSSEEETKASGDAKTPVKIVSGAAVIPQDAGVQSIAIPPLLTLNKKFSEIPVPIPNTSIVHYAKVNTLVHKIP